MLRRTFAKALIASTFAGQASAREETVAPCRVLAIGFNYGGPTGLPAVGAGEAAARVAQAFAQLEGATVTRAFDEGDVRCNRERLNRIVDAWAATVQSGEVALIYYCGHGSRLDGRFHIVAQDPALTPFQHVIDRAAARRPSAIVAFVDACRTPPTTEIPRIGLDGRPLTGSEQARTAPDAANAEIRVGGRNVALIYSTQADDTADAGTATSLVSPFTNALLKYMGNRVDLATLFGLIMDDVRPQIPTTSYQLSRPVFLNGRTPPFGRARDAWLNIPH